VSIALAQLGSATLAVTVLVFLIVVILSLTTLFGLVLLLVGLLLELAILLTLSVLPRLTTLLVFVFRIVCHENLLAKHEHSRAL
jgi:hypothetical protein